MGRIVFMFIVAAALYNLGLSLADVLVTLHII